MRQTIECPTYHFFEDAHGCIEISQNLIDDVATMGNRTVRQGETDITDAFETFRYGIENLDEKRRS